MIEKAQMFTPDQVQAFIAIMATLALTNAGSLVGGVVSYLRRNRKMRADINEAHNRIRNLNDRLNKIEKQQTGEQK